MKKLVIGLMSAVMMGSSLIASELTAEECIKKQEYIVDGTQYVMDTLVVGDERYVSMEDIDEIVGYKVEGAVGGCYISHEGKQIFVSSMWTEEGEYVEISRVMDVDIYCDCAEDVHCECGKYECDSTYGILEEIESAEIYNLKDFDAKMIKDNVTVWEDDEEKISVDNRDGVKIIIEVEGERQKEIPKSVKDLVDEVLEDRVNDKVLKQIEKQIDKAEELKENIAKCIVNEECEVRVYKIFDNGYVVEVQDREDRIRIGE